MASPDVSKLLRPACTSLPLCSLFMWRTGREAIARRRRSSCISGALGPGSVGYNSRGRLHLAQRLRMLLAAAQEVLDTWLETLFFCASALGLPPLSPRWAMEIRSDAARFSSICIITVEQDFPLGCFWRCDQILGSSAVPWLLALPPEKVSRRGGVLDRRSPERSAEERFLSASAHRIRPGPVALEVLWDNYLMRRGLPCQDKLAFPVFGNQFRMLLPFPLLYFRA
ncbi:uncharacterized protein LOC112978946 [Dromaius novaehollandiae]|uniref:uncharacterized protein LOC112978946 n=1 Tax=Dromaius novaehollandiae TaxID=8790 RepID=UPI003120339C